MLLSTKTRNHQRSSTWLLTWGEISAHHPGSLSAHGGGGGPATGCLNGRAKGRTEHDSSTHFRRSWTILLGFIGRGSTGNFERILSALRWNVPTSRRGRSFRHPSFLRFYVLHCVLPSCDCVCSAAHSLPPQLIPLAHSRSVHKVLELLLCSFALSAHSRSVHKVLLARLVVRSRNPTNW